MNYNPTAAQPLDLDKITRYGFLHGSDEPAGYVLRAELDFLIAQARAAQPKSDTLASQEDTTGTSQEETTGASRAEALRQEVCIMYQYLDDREWAEHIAVTPEGHCLETAITRLVSENADLRAQLAANGQGGPIYQVGTKTVGSHVIEWMDVSVEDYEGYTDGLHRIVHLSAPASAQPADESELAKHLRAAHAFIENTDAFGGAAASGILECGGVRWDIDASKAALTRHLTAPASAQPALPPVVCVGRPFPSQDQATVFFSRNVTDDELLELNRLLGARVNNPSAQPDRGAAQGNGQPFTEWLAKEMPAGTVIGDPAWWAPRILRAALAPSPASQPVAPTLMRQAVSSVVSRVGNELRVGWLRPERCDVGTLLYCASEPVPAVAPSDAKGKADAANAVQPWRERSPLAMVDTTMAAIHMQAEICDLRALLSNQSPATSAADAKDADPIMHLCRVAGAGLFPKPGARIVFKPHEGCAHCEELARRAAMAAAQSSEKGDSK